MNYKLSINKKIDTKEEKNKGNIHNIVKGSIIAIIITLIIMLFVSVIYTFTNISEKYISGIIIIVSAMSIMIGSIVASRNIGKKGILNGAFVGIIYLSVIYLMSSIIICGFSLNQKSIIMIISSIILGIIGGIIGVNTSFIGNSKS